MGYLQRLRLARRVLFLKVLVTIFGWAMPLWFAPLHLLAQLDMPIPGNPIYLRVVGAITMASGIAHLLAHITYPRNKGLLVFATAENLLVAATIFVVGMQFRVGWFIWMAGFLTLFFGLSLLLLTPWNEETPKDRHPM